MGLAGAYLCGSIRTHAGAEQNILLPFRIDALAVLKQIATMVLAVAAPGRKDAMRALRRFVRVPFEQLHTGDISVRVYLNPRRKNWKEPQARMGGVSVAMNMMNRTSTTTLAEIEFPPLGYWTAWANGPQPQLAEFLSLADITHFGAYPYRKASTVMVRMPVRTPVGPFIFHEGSI